MFISFQAVLLLFMGLVFRPLSFAQEQHECSYTGRTIQAKMNCGGKNLVITYD